MGSGDNANALATEMKARNLKKNVGCKYMTPKLLINLIAMFLFLSISGEGIAEEKKIISWITKEEAALPAMKHPETGMGNRPNSENQAFLAKEESMAGPIIKIEKPDSDKLYNDLIDILIHFDRNPIGESVDMNSLRVIYLKMFGIDITDRILPYVKETRIDANGINFPEGEHEFEIRIKDTDELESNVVFMIKVN